MSQKAYDTCSSVSCKAIYNRTTTKRISLGKVPASRYRTRIIVTAAVGGISETEQTVFWIATVTNIAYIHKAIIINGRPLKRQEEWTCKVDKINTDNNNTESKLYMHIMN